MCQTGALPAALSLRGSKQDLTLCEPQASLSFHLGLESLQAWLREGERPAWSSPAEPQWRKALRAPSMLCSTGSRAGLSEEASRFPRRGRGGVGNIYLQEDAWAVPERGAAEVSREWGPWFLYQHSGKDGASMRKQKGLGGLGGLDEGALAGLWPPGSQAEHCPLSTAGCGGPQKSSSWGQPQALGYTWPAQHPKFLFTVPHSPQKLCGSILRKAQPGPERLSQMVW